MDQPRDQRMHRRSETRKTCFGPHGGKALGVNRLGIGFIRAQWLAFGGVFRTLACVRFQVREGVWHADRLRDDDRGHDCDHARGDDGDRAHGGDHDRA